ncbi:hypothetical protein [Myxococcus faecalis]|uniref:hypothetical protein n=1 Tax=Myxococcus faecalis TaxID=3115646 RepID=UPI003CF494AA
MPMVDCAAHGLVEVAFYCSHVETCLKEGVGCEVDFVFDDLGDGSVLCAECLTLAREYVRKHRSETIEEYPVRITGGCIEHLQEWGEQLNNVDLNALLTEAARRTRRRPER